MISINTEFSQTFVSENGTHRFRVLDSDSGAIIGVCYFHPETMDEWSHDLELAKSLDVHIHTFDGFIEEFALKAAIRDLSGGVSKTISQPTPSRPTSPSPKPLQERTRSGKKLHMTVTKWRPIDGWDLAVYDAIVRSPESVRIDEVAVRGNKVVIVGDGKRLAVDTVSLNGVELILEHAGTVTATFYKENPQ